MCHECGCGPEAHGSAKRTGTRRPAARVLVEESILSKNDRLAGENRALLQSKGILALNLVSSPGSGKTRLLETTLRDLGGEMAFYVIEGDQQTSNDADRIARTGAPVVQINTGSGCHLDADMVMGAIRRLEVPEGAVLMIENVGNLVCPAMFDLGETLRVVIISVTEGEDKPQKYPEMFASSDVCIINKTDLLPYLECDVERLKGLAREVNPRLVFLEHSDKLASPPWYAWLREQRARPSLSSRSPM